MRISALAHFRDDAGTHRSYIPASSNTAQCGALARCGATSATDAAKCSCSRTPSRWNCRQSRTGPDRLLTAENDGKAQCSHNGAPRNPQASSSVVAPGSASSARIRTRASLALAFLCSRELLRLVSIWNTSHRLERPSIRLEASEPVNPSSARVSGGHHVQDAHLLNWRIRAKGSSPTRSTRRL